MMRAATAAVVVTLGGVPYHWLVRDRVLNRGVQEEEAAARLRTTSCSTTPTWRQARSLTLAVIVRDCP
jgi:hypothetical protein